MPAVSAGQDISLPMFRRAWKIRAGDALAPWSLALLFIEIVKATRTSRREILNHALSMLTFIGAVVEFLC